MPHQQATRIPRSLHLAMILQFAVGGAVMPFVTILLRDRGLNFAQIGQIYFSSSATLLIFPFLWGMLADRYLPIDRLFTLLNALAGAALLLFLRRESHWGLLAAFTWFCACFVPTLTLINALSFHHLANPREQFGVLRSWGSIGWMLPSLPIYLWLTRSPTGRLDFVLVMGIVLSLVMTAMTFSLPHTPPGAGRATGHPQARLAYWPAVKCLVRDRDYVTILASFFLMAGSYSIYIYYSPPLLEDLGFKRAWIGPIQCIGVVVEVVLFRWRPRFLQSWSYPASILIGCVALLARHLLFVLARDPWLLCASYLLAGVVIVFYHIGISILVNAIAGAEVRATAQTLLVFFGSGMGPMCSNWVAGHLAASAGGNLRPVFFFAAALAALASLLIFLRRAKLEKASQGKGSTR